MLLISVRKWLRIVNMIVFVNQMLLMRAGDVERNPGPGERDESVIPTLYSLQGLLQNPTRV